MLKTPAQVDGQFRPPIIAPGTEHGRFVHEDIVRQFAVVAHDEAEIR
jgi:hypothetical protein